MTQLEHAPRPNHEAIPPEERPAASPVPHPRIDPQRNTGLIWTGVLVLLVVIAVLWRSFF
jgi:hypothetical protein